MKIKILTALFVCITLLFFGCVSEPKSINFNDLTSKTFILNYTSYMTNMDEYNKDISNLYVLLPIQSVINKIEKEYNIKIDTSLYSSSEAELKEYNGFMPNYFIQIPTEVPQRARIHFHNFNQEKEAQAIIFLSIYENGNVSHQSSYTINIPKESLFVKQ
ncbi:MAG: hypothetical protein FWB77_01135 [Treponema sp.]|nr:hypothetical protein [Treponema sp.]